MTATELTLSAQKRPLDKKAKHLRNEKKVPGIVYGNISETIPVSVGASEMLKTYRKAGHSSLITIDLEGKKIKALIHEIQQDPVKDSISHVDFFAVNLKEKTVVKVPIIFEGESPAVKNYGGIFMAEHDELEIRCLPSEIPSEIRVDISKLTNIHDQIFVRDLGLEKEKHEILKATGSTVICGIAAPKIEKEEVKQETTAETTTSATTNSANQTAAPAKKEEKKPEKK